MGALCISVIYQSSSLFYESDYGRLLFPVTELPSNAGYLKQVTLQFELKKIQRHKILTR
jgi:hypothetical protein